MTATKSTENAFNANLAVISPPKKVLIILTRSPIITNFAMVIENKKGIEYVEKEFVKRANINLVAARGDLYVELEKPHEILKAVKTIIQHDPDAIVGSRILLSTITDPVPSCADFTELAWLYDIGYKNMMLCDELCLKEPLLNRAINAFDCFRKEYGRPLVSATIPPSRPPSSKKKKSLFEWWMK